MINTFRLCMQVQPCCARASTADTVTAIAPRCKLLSKGHCALSNVLILPVCNAFQPKPKCLNLGHATVISQDTVAASILVMQRPGHARLGQVVLHRSFTEVSNSQDCHIADQGALEQAMLP